MAASFSWPKMSSTETVDFSVSLLNETAVLLCSFTTSVLYTKI
jgi:hypothetical protein